MKITKGLSPNVLIVDIDTQINEPQWFLLRSDAHHDNVDCLQDLEKKHLDQALDCGAGILDAGDLFCCMSGKFDRRSSKSKLRPEHKTGDYLDALVDTAAEFYAPYANNWISFGLGNHETSILDRHETNLTERLVQTLKTMTKCQAAVTGYTGWVQFRMRKKGTTSFNTWNLWHMHGYGGGGPVTSDTIQAQRQRAYVEGADVLWSGHTHDAWVKEDHKIILSPQGLVKQKPVWYVKSPTYKDEYKSGAGGWHVQTGKVPKPLGAWWMRLTLKRERKEGRETQYIECHFEKAE